jgi:rubrerythrin
MESAIKTALEYERKICDLYFEGASILKGKKGENIFEALGKDEQYHIAYLEKKLREWQEKGALDSDMPVSTIPEKEDIEKSIDRLRADLTDDHRGLVQQILNSALKAEIETSKFYSNMVDALPEQGKKLFRRFLEIEENHIKTVQYELDFISGTGYWFNIKEFDME